MCVFRFWNFSWAEEEERICLFLRLFVQFFVWISLLFLFLLLFLVQEFGGRCALKSVEMMFIRVLEGLDPMSGV